MSRHMCPSLGVQIGSAVHVTVVLAQARAYVCTRRHVGGEMRMCAQDSRRKVASEADVTSSVTMLANHERFVRLVALVTPQDSMHEARRTFTRRALRNVPWQPNAAARPNARTLRLGVDAQLTFVRVHEPAG